jgi:CRP-like cAMP-binding protein
MSNQEMSFLQDIPAFGALAPAALSFLLQRAGSVTVAKDHYFYHEEDPAESFYVLETGKVIILKNWAGQTYHLRDLETGDCFGEMALIDMLPRSASVKAVVDCRAIELRLDDLHQLYQYDIGQFLILHMNLAREVSRRLRAADKRIFEMDMRKEQPMVVSTTTSDLKGSGS